MGVRRVVTGHDVNGNAIFVDEVEVDPITVALVPGMEFYRVTKARRASLRRAIQ